MEIEPFSDEYFMNQALREAQKAFAEDEVPVGVVVVYKKQIIARAHNYTQRLNDVTAHAEMQAITSAANYINGKYLDQCDFYVTLEPCVMCAGALAWARPKRVIFGAFDAKRGFTMVDESILNKKTELSTGVLIEPCGKILTQFFEEKRKLD